MRSSEYVSLVTLNSLFLLPYDERLVLPAVPRPVYRSVCPPYGPAEVGAIPLALLAPDGRILVRVAADIDERDVLGVVYQRPCGEGIVAQIIKVGLAGNAQVGDRDARRQGVAVDVAAEAVLELAVKCG